MAQHRRRSMARAAARDRGEDMALLAGAMLVLGVAVFLLGRFL